MYKRKQMIIETMSYQEIARRFDMIYDELNQSINLSPYRRFFIKNKKATNVVFQPKKRTIDENTYAILVPMNLSYKDFMKNGLQGATFLVYGTSKGKMLVSKGWSCKINAYTYTFYTSHFFDRYRERVLKDLTRHKDEVMMDYFKRNVYSACEYFNNGYKDSNRSFFTITNEGVALGICIDTNKLLYKTFIDYDSLSRNKQEKSDYLSNMFKEYGGMMEKMRQIISHNPKEALAISDEIKFRNLL